MGFQPFPSRPSRLFIDTVRVAHYALSATALAKARTVDAEHMQLALDELRP